MESTEEIVLRGSPMSKGIGIGRPVFFLGAEHEVSSHLISQREVEQEIERYRNALDLSRKDLEHLQKISMQNGSEEVVAILGTHLEMMQDPLITQDIEQKIRQTHHNTEWIFASLIEEYKLRFSALKDSYFQERIRDIIDISRRIFSHLRPLGRVNIADVPHNSVILAHELVPSETIEAQASSVSGFVTATGGLTSHAAIIARAKGIPYVANIDLKSLKEESLHSMIVDGVLGIVILNPTHETLQKYEELKRQQQENVQTLKHTSHLKGETIDGYEVRIFANLENPKEIETIIESGAAGIGLFRSEYLCLANKRFPSEEEQFEIYKSMVKALQGKPLVVRVYDLGGDKKVDIPPDHADSVYFTSIGHEVNPALGCRAIRFLLRYPEVLETQLRAIMRASYFGEIHILVPMVSDVSELRIVRSKMKQLEASLREEGFPFAKNIPLGCMIEVPSSALMCDAIAKESDFLSVGTNDLVQYILAADRTNLHTSDLYYSAHPGVLRLIRSIVVSAAQEKKPLILCGEMAADPMLIPVLLGLGISEFSVAVRHIPIVKHTIRKWRLLEACCLAEGALGFGSAPELKEYLQLEALKS